MRIKNTYRLFFAIAFALSLKVSASPLFFNLNKSNTLEKRETASFFCINYNEEGNLITKVSATGTFEYSWYGNGMLKSVTDPKNKTTEFEYDALGRRTAKISSKKSISQTEPVEVLSKSKTITRWVWDGNVPLHLSLIHI